METIDRIMDNDGAIYVVATHSKAFDSYRVVSYHKSLSQACAAVDDPGQYIIKATAEIISSPVTDKQ